MNFNIRELTKTLFKSEEHNPEWHNWHEFLTFILWDATDILLTYSTLFHEKGYQRLNLRSVDFIENINHCLASGLITYTQAINFLGEWLGTLLAKEPGYILVFRDILFTITDYNINVSTKHLFINIFIGGHLFDTAEIERAKKERAKTHRRRKEENRVENDEESKVESKAEVRDQEESNRPTVVAKKGRLMFRSFLTSQQISVLYEQLVLEGYISGSVTFETFECLFDERLIPFSTPIIWYKKTVHLTYLLYALCEEQNLIQGNWQTHFGERKRAFRSKGGKIFSSSNLSSNVKNILDKKSKAISFRPLFASIIMAVTNA